MTSLTTVSRLGQVNAAGSDTALFLKKYGGEVLMALERQLVIIPHVTHKYADNGKSAQFPATGLATAKHHIAGESIYTTAGYLDGIKANELEIFVDRPLMGGPIAIDSWDELVNHYEVRTAYANQIAQAIGKVLDQRCLIAGTIGARQSTPNVTGLPNGGSQLAVGGGAKGTPNGNTNAAANVLTDAAVFLEALRQARVFMDKNDVPDDGERYVGVSPELHSLLAMSGSVTNLIDRDLNPNGNGSFSKSEILLAAGFKILKTNSGIRSATPFTTPTGCNNSYAITPANHAALCWHKSGIGFVSWRDMVMQYDKDNMEYQCDVMLGKFIGGLKYLRQEALFEITTA